MNAQTDQSIWIHVDAHNAQGVQARELGSQWRSFEELIKSAKGSQTQSYSLDNLKLPLPSVALASLGLGLSYPSHQKEVKAEDPVFFRKDAQATSLGQAIPFREFTDYEAEVSLLLHRSEPQIFGYLMHNDLTDRRIQVENYDKKNPAPGFSKSKSLENFNAHGLLLAVGTEKLWKQIEVRLYVNGEAVQSVKPSENLMSPSAIHKEVFSRPELHQNRDWVLIGTGTPAGTIFYAPSVTQKIWLFVSSGFSMKRAQEKWLERFNFLQVNDSLEFRSALLGHIDTTIVDAKVEE